MSGSATDNEGPWYRDGLRFKCTQCGNCCTGAPGVVWVTDDDITAIADFLDKPVGEIRLMHTRQVRGRISLTEFANGDCTFFDPHGRGCTIYPVRPSQCRTWPFWRGNLATEQDWQEVQKDCPGAGRGDFFALEDIEIRLSESDV